MRMLPFVLAFLLSCAAFSDSGRPKPGDVAPAFSLESTSGKQVSLADYSGQRTVVLAFFPKAFTGG